MAPRLRRTQLIALPFIGAFFIKEFYFKRRQGVRWSQQQLQENALVVKKKAQRHDFIAVSVSLLSVSINPTGIDPDAACPFRQSPLYRSIFVYPSPNETLFESMKSDRAGVVSNNGTVPMWPWLPMNEEFRNKQFLVYNIKHDEMNQFTLEQYVHDIMTHPHSCLQTKDPEKAKLFYIPLMETLYWRGLERLGQLPAEWMKNRMTPYSEALLNAIDGKYDLWEDRFGLTSRFWKRKEGADHFFVMAEPCNGLQHIPGARANTNYVIAQRQNRPPIVISSELAVSYVRMYSKCAAKNIVMPYPNVNGKWFRGHFESRAKSQLPSLLASAGQHSGTNNAGDGGTDLRPVLIHVSAGTHGQCAGLRQGLLDNHHCSKSYSMISKHRITRQVQMHLAKFCPCPAGDSPSARRMNDAVVAGCIPVVLSADYVWPLSKDVDPTSEIDPSTFSIRLNFRDFGRSRYDGKQCHRVDGNLTLEEYLERIPSSEIDRLQKGMKRVAPIFEYYQRRNMSDAPLSDRQLPDGGAAYALVQELAKRAVDNRWEQCQEELKVHRKGQEPTRNRC